MRIEKDTLGPVEVPEDAYWGAQTQRAICNFPVSGLRESPALVEAYVHIKRAAALANRDSGKLRPEIADAIVRAADEILVEGRFRDQFPVDVFQAGAGTSFNMNVNEVLANRACELLGKRKGDVGTVHPNDHVNMSQSTNDTFPTATHLACLRRARELAPGVDALAASFERKGEEWKDLLKAGRTHLQDAMPITLGQQMRSYAESIRKAGDAVRSAADGLREVALGGTAVGTGTNITPGYRRRVLRYLSEATGFELRAPADPRHAMRSAFALQHYSAALRGLAIELSRIASDLRLMDSGPMTGMAELRMPPVQPGSSIMPGKVNPVMAECLNMICFQVMGHDHVVAIAAEHGQFEINVFWPVIAYNLLQATEILARYLPHFAKECVEGMVAEKERCAFYAETTPALATVLNPLIGYARAAEIAKEAVARRVSVRTLLKEKGFLSDQEIERLFDPRALTGALDSPDA